MSRFVLAGMSDIGLDGFILSSVGNTDLIARTVRQGGWWAFERPLPALFLRCSQAWPGLFVDVGANTGFYSLLHSACLENGRAIAFEPYPPVAEVLRENIALNAFDDRISVSQEAVSAVSGEAKLFVPPPAHGLIESRGTLEAAFLDAHERVLTVQTIALDVLETELEGLAMIKIDVEGHEASVIAGARATIAKHRPILILGILGGAQAEIDQMRSRKRYRSVVLGTDEIIAQDTLQSDPRGWNHILIPEEKWVVFAEIVSALGLRLST